MKRKSLVWRREGQRVVSAYHGDAEAPYVRLDAVAFLVQVRVDPLGLKLDMIKKIKIMRITF